ncbi:MAG TPA: phosphopantetheine adenylyltransferase [Noviherbaspirillum sp.]|nr:phosphopantetheine adenylyltransferase [Noviherbaspirillum sp.]
MNRTISILLAVVGVIHLLPLSGVLGAERLAVLYGLSFDDPSLQIMMRHRAVLFGMLGAFLLFAAVRPELRAVALIAGFASTLSFLWLAWSVGGYNAAIGRVVAADVVAVGCLAAALALHLLQQRAAVSA